MQGAGAGFGGGEGQREEVCFSLHLCYKFLLCSVNSVSQGLFLDGEGDKGEGYILLNLSET